MNRRIKQIAEDDLYFEIPMGRKKEFVNWWTQGHWDALSPWRCFWRTEWKLKQKLPPQWKYH